MRDRLGDDDRLEFVGLLAAGVGEKVDVNDGVRRRTG